MVVYEFQRSFIRLFKHFNNFLFVPFCIHMYTSSRRPNICSFYTIPENICVFNTV